MHAQRMPLELMFFMKFVLLQHPKPREAFNITCHF